LGIACVLALYALQTTIAHREPRANGHTLSYWIAVHGSQHGKFASEKDRQRGAEAIRAIGTNGLAHLLRWMDYEPPRWLYTVGPWMAKLPTKVLNSSAVLWLSREPANERAQNARDAFRALGSVGTPALTELERRAFLTNSPARRDNARLALAYLGSPAVPIIARMLSAPDATGDGWLAACVHTLGTNALPLVPIFIKGLQASNAMTACFSAATLGEMRLNPELTIPALSNCLADPRREVRMEAPRALMKFNELAQTTLPSLTNLLNDPDPDVRRNAATAIKRIIKGDIPETRWQ